MIQRHWKAIDREREIVAAKAAFSGQPVEVERPASAFAVELSPADQRVRALLRAAMVKAKTDFLMPGDAVNGRCLDKKTLKDMERRGILVGGFASTKRGMRRIFRLAA